jgi:pilus assembly protein CpaF
MSLLDRLSSLQKKQGDANLQGVAAPEKKVPNAAAEKSAPVKKGKVDKVGTERSELRAVDAEQLKQERSWVTKIMDEMMEDLDLGVLSALQKRQAEQEIESYAQDLMEKRSVPLSNDARQRIIRFLKHEILGLGPLEELMDDSSISDIMINGSQNVYVERRGLIELSHVTFRDDAHLMQIIDRIVTSVGRRVDEASPMVDARLADGSRVNVIIPPLAIDGPSMSIRRFAVERLTMDNLVALGSINEQIAAILKSAVKLGLNIIISGGTGSGKTTLLNILSGYIPANERIVTIEDSAELQLQQPHVVRLETRPMNIEGRGEITQRDLIRNSLRMRPDRLVIGEVRGGEALDMLQAMNTGHDGSLATLHANTPRDALSRIENMVAMSGVNFGTKALRSQMASAVDLIVQIQRLEDGRRKMTSIQEVQGLEGDIITTSEIFKFERLGLSDENEVLGEFRPTGIVPKFFSRLKPHGIDLPIEVFQL